VTLTGPGGVGKTRLAIEVGHRATVECGYTVYFVDLSHVIVSAPTEFEEALVRALSLSPSANIASVALAADFLLRLPTLLVLDNLDNCIAVAPETIRTLIQQAPQLRILITSRQVLNVSGEHEIVVQPLALPERGASAEQQHDIASVRLFMDRARAVRSDFIWTARQFATIAELCIRLEGLPLAIELAAARMRVLSPAEILAQLKAHLDVLEFHANDVCERHRTLRATLDWSYHRLTDEHKRRFALLSVLQGEWTVAAAAAVWQTADALSDLQQLREQSLIMVASQEGEARYRVLETMREYAREKLTSAEYQAAQHRLALYQVRWAEVNAPDFERIQREQINLRQALLCLHSNGSIEEALQLIVALKYFWFTSRHAQYGQWGIEILLASGAMIRAELRAEAILCAQMLRLPQEDGIHWLASLDVGRTPEGALLSNQQRWEAELAQRGAELNDIETHVALLEASGDAEKAAFAAGSYGSLLCWQGDWQRADEKLERSLRLYREQRQHWGIQLALEWLGKLAMATGDFTKAILRYEEHLAFVRQSGFVPGVVHALWLLAHAHQHAGSQAQADRYMAESLALCRQQSEPGRLIALLGVVGHLALARKDYAAAHTHFSDPLMTSEKLDSFQLQINSLRHLALTAWLQQDLAEAIELSHRRLALSRQGGESAEEASSAADLALLHLCREEKIPAAHYLCISLDLFAEELRCHYALEVCARLAFAEGKPALAICLLATADRLRMERLVEIPIMLRGDRDTLIHQLHADLTPETFALHWAEGHSTSHTNAIIEARHLLSTIF
jgi:predicted ATPase